MTIICKMTILESEMEIRKTKGKSWRHSLLMVSITLLLIALPLLGACAEK